MEFLVHPYINSPFYFCNGLYTVFLYPYLSVKFEFLRVNFNCNV
nr:MAG TPA: hypothetical protein [Caudoviricetes sp.]